MTKCVDLLVGGKFQILANKGSLMGGNKFTE